MQQKLTNEENQIILRKKKNYFLHKLNRKAVKIIISCQRLGFCRIGESEATVIAIGLGRASKFKCHFWPCILLY